MIEDSESTANRSSEDLWSEICSSLPEPEEPGPNDGQFTDSFQPPSQSCGSSITTFSPWEPMEDSEVYIASLGTVTFTGGQESAPAIRRLWGPIPGLSVAPRRYL